MEETRTSPQYVHDPEAVAIVTGLLRKWPAIGMAADHPLTEYFLTRERRRWARLKHVSWARLIWGAAWVLGVIAVCLLFPQFAIITLMAGGALERALRRFFVRPVVRDITAPIHLVQDANVGRLEQIYLAPIRFLDLLGSAAACYRRQWLKYAAGLALLLTAMMVFLIVLVRHRAYPDYVLPFEISIAAIMLAVGAVICSPSAIVAIGIRNLFAELNIGTSALAMKSEGVFLQGMWIALVVTPFAMLPVLIGLGFTPWIVLTTAACVFECYVALRYMNSIVPNLFARYGWEGQALFHEYMEARIQANKP